MKTHNNLIYYFISITLFILLKIGYTQVNNDLLSFLLLPTSSIIELITGSNYSYLSEHGYYFMHLNITIDKSCSGFNFLLISFLSFNYLALNHTNKNKILTIPIALILSYLLTIIVNSSRIFVSIIIQGQTKHMFSSQQPIIHESIGVITNITFLVMTYFLIEKILIKKATQ